MPTNPAVRKTPSGELFMTGRDGNEELLNPRVLSERESSTVRRPGKQQPTKFKLLTIRRLTRQSLETAKQELEKQQRQLEAIALRTGQPAPYPSKIPVTTDDVKQVFGVYIDEDLNGTTAPVYVFSAPSDRMKAFITANGEEKTAWSVHIAHSVERLRNPDGTLKTIWRLYTIDNQLLASERSDYFLDSIQLPECYQENYDIDSLVYLGGGGWSGLAIDSKDKIPLIATAPSTKKDRYIPVGAVTRYIGEGRFPAIVQYSVTPSYSFTWCRGHLKTTYRERAFDQKLDIKELLDSGVITVQRDHQYALDLCYRPALPYLGPASERLKKEISSGTATYVGNTNYATASIYQSPDYGTDVSRLAIAAYSMETNVVRPVKFEKSTNLSLLKLSYQEESHIPILASSPTFSTYISLNPGTFRGSLKHGYEQKGAIGKRGFDYPDYYKYWWVYGKILETYSIGDTNRYRLSKSSGSQVKIGSMFDLGELKIDDRKNRVITTWDSLRNPQTGFFGIESGTLTFAILYLNPPLIGHDGVYYYEINPENIGSLWGGDRTRLLEKGSAAVPPVGLAPSYVAGSDDPQENANQMLTAYSQFLGAIGGGAVSSLNIGTVTIAPKDGESVVVRSPTPGMKAAMQERPELFPSGFWDGDLLDVVLKDSLQYTEYDSQGEVVKSWTS
ncbi:hypothetical protein [Chroococcidiopsis sp.]|uniref:hypothetical protein n=1 Tax=Chroococcidiopsis sp. TaxID=3088168 RepID=UPI003F3201BB